MANEKMKPQSPEEIARAAQEAALEQMRAMMGSIPGMPDMGDMQAQIMAQMQAAVPDLAEIQAQQAAMGTLGGVDAAAVAEAARQNMAQAAATMQAMQGGSLEKELREANAAALAWLGEDDGWEIKHAATCRLTAEQRRLLAFAAPLLVYNDEAVDTVESEVLPETYRAQLQSWWNITDRDSTLGIAEFMIENGYCTTETLPRTVIAWDLVRIANLGRWALHAGYLSEEEMWQVMQVAADTAREHFVSWEEYGRSFAMGRGVWHGDEEDCQTAWEIVTTLLEEETSPWQQIPWNA